MYIASWSGGKDGCMACHLALEGGLDVKVLANFVSTDALRVKFHGTRTGLVQAQAKLAGLELLQQPAELKTYEDNFKTGVHSIMDKQKVTGMVFGDIYLNEHRQWIENICAELGIKAELPLWGKDTAKLARHFVASGFEAVIVAANAELIDSEWLGRKYDEQFIQYAESKGIDPCGESGEFHTLVVSAPLFKGSINIMDGETVRNEGYLFYEIKQYECVPVNV